MTYSKKSHNSEKEYKVQRTSNYLYSFEILITRSESKFHEWGGVDFHGNVYVHNNKHHPNYV